MIVVSKVKYEEEEGPPKGGRTQKIPRSERVQFHAWSGGKKTEVRGIQKEKPSNRERRNYKKGRRKTWGRILGRKGGEKGKKVSKTLGVRSLWGEKTRNWSGCRASTKRGA